MLHQAKLKEKSNKTQLKMTESSFQSRRSHTHHTLHRQAMLLEIWRSQVQVLLLPLAGVLS